MMHVGTEIACFLQDPIFCHIFLIGMIFSWNLEDMSLFECKRSDSVSFNVILINRYRDTMRKRSRRVSRATSF